MQKHTIILVAAAALALSGCKKDAANDAGQAGTPAQAPTGMLGQATAQAQVEQAAAALPQPDANKPLSSYPELKSGDQIMFLYVAASKLPPDYAKLAEASSREYRDTSDTFRKNDLLKALTPQLDQKIAEAKANPYGWMEIDEANLGAYDFDRKGFPVGEFQGSGTRYFSRNSDYTIGWANASQLGFVPVTDEAAARAIESMRSGYNDRPRLKIYFFAQSADLNEQKVNAYVTRAQIVDKSGRVLAEYGPGQGANQTAPGAS